MSAISFLESEFAKAGKAIASFFGSHAAVIQSVISDAQTAAVAAASVATALGEAPSVTTEIGKISDGLSLVSSAVAADASAPTLTQQAAVAGSLVAGLVGSGDIGIKNDDTKAAIGTVLTKVQGVVGALETAAAAAPATPAS